MEQEIAIQSSFAAMFDPAVARAAAERAAKWNLPRHTCRPLDRYCGSKVGADLAAFDEACELAPVGEDEIVEEPLHAATDTGVDIDTDFDEDDDL